MPKQKTIKIPRSYLYFFTTIVIFGIGLTMLHFSSCSKVHAFSCGITSQISSSEKLAANYYQYSKTTLENVRTNGKIVLYFWAPWCSTCTSLDRDLQAKKVRVPDGITLLRVNYDQEKLLKQQYNVITQHTFVQVDTMGNAIHSWVGGDINDFATQVK